MALTTYSYSYYYYSYYYYDYEVHGTEYNYQDIRTAMDWSEDAQ
jgi:hypothetical protein